MSVIQPYIGIEKSEAPDNRFVAYSRGVPALMIEFFKNNYHLYGPRSNNTRVVIWSSALAFHYYLALIPRKRVGAFFIPPEFFRDGAASITGVTNEDEAFERKVPLASLWEAVEEKEISAVLAPRVRFRMNTRNLEELEKLLPSNISYLVINIPNLRLSLWADTESERQPRSGVSLDTSLLTEGERKPTPVISPGAPFLPVSLALSFVAPVKFSSEEISELTDFIDQEVARRYV